MEEANNKGEKVVSEKKEVNRRVSSSFSSNEAFGSIPKQKRTSFEIGTLGGEAGSTAAQSKEKGEDEERIAELKREIENVKARLAIYEQDNSDRIALNTQAEKGRLRKIFDMFDSNADGCIDEKEFQDLAYHLGETITRDEASEYVKHIDADGNGNLSFDEFFNWWKSTDLIASSSEKNEKMYILKMKLKSKAYVRSLSRLGEKIARAREKASLLKLRNSSDQSMSNCSINIRVGNLSESCASVVLKYHNDANLAEENRKKFGGKASSMLLTFAFKIRDGVADFSVGELSAHIKILLPLVKHTLKFTDYKTKVFTEEGKRLFGISLFFEEESTVKEVMNIVETLQIRTLEASLHLNEVPARNVCGIEPPRFQFLFKVELPRKSVEVLENVMFPEESSPQVNLHNKEFTDAKKQNKSKLLRRCDAAKNKFLMVLWKMLISARIVASFDDVVEFLQTIEIGGGIAKEVEGWSILKYFFIPIFRNFVKDPEVPSSVPGVYDNFINTLEGICEVNAQIGSYVLSLKSDDLPLFDLLPTLDDIDEFESSEYSTSDSDSDSSDEDESE